MTISWTGPEWDFQPCGFDHRWLKVVIIAISAIPAIMKTSLSVPIYLQLDFPVDVAVERSGGGVSMG